MVVCCTDIIRLRGGSTLYTTHAGISGMWGIKRLRHRPADTAECCKRLVPFFTYCIAHACVRCYSHDAEEYRVNYSVQGLQG